MNNYEDYQNARDKEYLAAWENLSPKERRRLEKAGITGPDAPVYRTHKRDDEAIVESAGHAPERINDDEDTPSDVSDPFDVIRQVIGTLMAHDNIEMTLDCFALITGISYGGESMVTIAKRYGVTRAAVSKRCVEMSEILGLPPSRAMRRLTARKAYEQRARQQHHRLGH
jgi:hypothetical protein